MNQSLLNDQLSSPECGLRVDGRLALIVFFFLFHLLQNTVNVIGLWYIENIFFLFFILLLKIEKISQSSFLHLINAFRN